MKCDRYKGNIHYMNVLTYDRSGKKSALCCVQTERENNGLIHINLSNLSWEDPVYRDDFGVLRLYLKPDDLKLVGILFQREAEPVAAGLEIKRLKDENRKLRDWIENVREALEG